MRVKKYLRQNKRDNVIRNLSLTKDKNDYN